MLPKLGSQYFCSELMELQKEPVFVAGMSHSQIGEAGHMDAHLRLLLSAPLGTDSEGSSEWR